MYDFPITHLAHTYTWMDPFAWKRFRTFTLSYTQILIGFWSCPNTSFISFNYFLISTLTHEWQIFTKRPYSRYATAKGNDNAHVYVSHQVEISFYAWLDELRRGCDWDGSLTDFSSNVNPVGNNWSNFSLLLTILLPADFISTATPFKSFLLIYLSFIFYVPIILHSHQALLRFLRARKLIWFSQQNSQVKIIWIVSWVIVYVCLLACLLASMLIMQTT